MNSHASRIFGLDLMRATAITMVVVGHLAWLFPDLPQSATMVLSLSSFFGVEIFFVLSGFLIGQILLREFQNEDFNLLRVKWFLRRRWLRTIPTYVLVLLLNLLVAIAYGQATDGSWRYFFFLQNFAWPMPTFFSESWSLSVEEFAYIILPLTLLFLASSTCRSSTFFKAIIGLMALGLLAKFAYHFASPSPTLAHWNLALKAVVIYRVDAIFTGVLFSWMSLRFSVKWKKWRWILAIAGLIGVGFFTVGVGALGLFIERFRLFWDVFYLPAVSFSFALFLPLLDSLKTVGAIGRPVRFVAGISYSVYLLHYSLLLQFFKHQLPVNAPFIMCCAAAIAYLFSLVICSYLLYRFFEKPVMDLRERPRRSLI